MKLGLNKYYYKDIGMVESYYANISLEFHREDGPAVEYANGFRAWYLNGEMIDIENNEQFLRIVKLRAFL